MRDTDTNVPRATKKRKYIPKHLRGTKSGAPLDLGRFETKQERDSFVLHKYHTEGVSVSLIASAALISTSLTYKIIAENRPAKTRMIHFIKPKQQ